MSRDLELKLLYEIAELKRKVNSLAGTIEHKIPTYQYSKIRDSDLKNLVDIEKT